MAPRKKAKKSRSPESNPAGRGEKPYEAGLGRVAANFQPLTPLTALERAAAVFPDHTAIIHGRRHFSYRLF
jgi:fatty-acyl-CoA synthase